MLKNYLVTAFNSLLKNRLYSLINIVGLSIGLAACLMIALYVQEQSSYDKHWRNADRLYRLNSSVDINGAGFARLGSSSLLAMPAIRNYFADEIESGSRIRLPSQDIYVDNVRFQQRIPYVDPELVEMLDFIVLHGDLAQSLSDPSSIALSAELSERLFDTRDSVGRVLEIERSVGQGESVLENFRVGAVYRMPDANSIVSLPAMVLFDQGKLDAFTFNNWGTMDFLTLVQLAPGIDVDSVNARMGDFTNRNVDIGFMNAGPDVEPADRMGFDLQDIRRVYLDEAVRDNVQGGNKTVVTAFSAIAGLILLIGCINFTILSTAKATLRAKEVAMRKTIGASRKQLVCQFMMESFLITIPAIFMSLMLAELMLPLFESMVGGNFDVDYTAPFTWLSLLALVVIVGVIGGIYPALVLSHFRPVETLKANKPAEGRGSIGLRGTLVVFQFSVSIALIIATAVIYAQVQYSANRDPGFNGDNILVVDNLNRRADVSALKAALKQEVETLPDVRLAALSSYQPMQTAGYSTLNMPITMEGVSNGQVRFWVNAIDEDFFNTFEIPVVAGRTYDQALDRPSPMLQSSFQEPESQSNIVINAAAAMTLGFASPQDALGARFSTPGFNPTRHSFNVIGVAADTQFYTLRNPYRPEMYVYSPQYITDVLNIKYTGNPAEVYSRVEAVWRSVMADAALTSSYVEENIAGVFAQEKLEAQMLVSFSLLAILIACLGLYGSAAFTVDRRTKEIGIRKVMGAEVREIVTLLMWQFSIPVLIANVIAWPAALWAMLTWLQRFPYQIDTLLLIPLCVLAGAIALSIAWLTVAGNTVKVATTNPVYALRYE